MVAFFNALLNNLIVVIKGISLHFLLKFTEKYQDFHELTEFIFTCCNLTSFALYLCNKIYS